MISPWSTSATLPSPDGRVTATIAEAIEIGMGAPTSGTLVLSGGTVRESCNPSMVWSDDSEYLAVPEWTSQRTQRLLVISARQGASRYAPGHYRVLELHDFAHGRVRGVDSPAWNPMAIDVDVSNTLTNT